MASRPNRQRHHHYVPRTRPVIEFSRLLKKTVGPTSNLQTTLEKIKQFFPKLQVEVVDDSELPNHEARAFPSRWLIKIRKGMYEGLIRGDVRARWTLMHEIAHILLRHPKHYLPRERDRDSSALYEREADIFVARFLASYEQALRCKDAEEIRDTFNISLEAARSRLEELKIEESLRSLARERGLPPESFSVEASYSRQFEDQSATVANAILKSVGEFKSEAFVPEPINGNYLGAAALVAAGSCILLKASQRFLLQSMACRYQEAAALATAILVIKPIRAKSGANTNSGIISECNQLCVRHAISAFLDVELSKLDSVTIPHPGNIAGTSFESSFLYSLTHSATTIVSETDLIATLDRLPGHRDYNEANCILRAAARRGVLEQGTASYYRIIK